ncbi:MAG: peptidase M61 [Ignavibacteria bacterium]
MKFVKNQLLAFTLLIFLFGNCIYSQNNDHGNDSRTTASFDLTKATGDHKLKVEVEPPVISSSTIKYFMPKIVPGTYAINNFGRFVSDMKAYDRIGNELAVKQLDTNSWEISDAANLKNISYWVEDTYHSDSKPVVFEPTGSCIDSGKVFMLNNFCLVGYFEGFKELPYTISITKPHGFYGATSMPIGSIAGEIDTYYPKNYFDLHDNPMMYTMPDTASVMVNNTKILLSVYSPNKTVSAPYLVEHTRELFEAQGKYLGGELPTDRYSVLVYLSDVGFKSNAAGALEHFKSTTFCYPELPKEQFVQPFKDVVSHEFFHIVTPLGIHSEEIGNFDFINPVMSKHLWLYEGSTEYYAHHSQVKFGVTTPGEFFSKIQQKILVSSLYFNDTLPFTELSKGALDKYKAQYVNVYLKGALINMCLDLYLLKLSEGKYGLQNLKSDLGIKYGPDVSFKDAELFDVITEMTYPEVRDFFSKYVEGNKRLPYKQFLGYAGYDFFDKYEKEVPTMIGADLDLGEDRSIVVSSVNEFGKKLKLKTGDKIFSVNGIEVNAHNFNEVSEKYEQTTHAGDEVTVVVLRKDKGSNYSKKTLKAKTYLVKMEDQYVIKPMKSPTAEELSIRRSWINQ